MSVHTLSVQLTRSPSRPLTTIFPEPRPTEAVTWLHPGLVRPASPVLAAMARPPIDPRAAAFSDLLHDIATRLQPLVGTRQDVLVVPGSGSYGMQVAVVNTLRPGDAVAVLDSGIFGQRFAALYRTYGARVYRLRGRWGEPVVPEAAAAFVAAHPTVRAVAFPAVESTTGVLNDVAAITAAVRQVAPDVLVVVDAVCALAAHAFAMDAWDVDIVCGAGHKAIGGPASLALLALSDRAWAAVAGSTRPRHCDDLRALRRLHASGQLRFTPPVPLLFGLAAALDAIDAESVLGYCARHAALATLARRLLESTGVPVLAAPPHAAHTVTVAQLPAGVPSIPLVAALAADGVVIGAGRGRLEQSTIRLGHFGPVTPAALHRAVAALRRHLSDRSIETEQMASYAI